MELLTNNSNQKEQRPPFNELVKENKYRFNRKEKEYLKQIDEAIGYCEEATKLENGQNARSFLLLGIANSFKARQTSIHQQRISLFQSAIQQFKQ